MSQTPAPQNPDKLLDSKWTAVEVEELRKHWQVTAFDEESGEATLEAVLDGHEVVVPWRQLRDREQWRPGWA